MSDDLHDRLEGIYAAYHVHGTLGEDCIEWCKAAAARIRELESRLATAEADARERAARVLIRAAEEIRSLKPETSDTKKAGE